MLATATNEINAINEAIAEKIGVQKHRVWFKNSTKFEIANNYFKIGVPNHFIGSWIENHFTGEIARAVQEVTGSEKKVSIQIDPELTGKQKRPQLDNKPMQVEKARSINTMNRVKPRKRNERMPLKLTLDSYIVGNGNQLAYNAAKTLITEDSSIYNPLFIHGGYGVGKTHLLQGICNGVSHLRPSAKWLYVSAEDFANQFVLALKTQKLDAFRNRFRNTDLLAIDDIHFLASKPSMQEEFLHTFNSIDLAGKQVVLASDAHPKMIGKLTESLVNRFVSGMVVKIDSPDFETRCKICSQKAATMKKVIPPAVIEYIAQEMHTNVRELEGAMLKLIAYSSISKHKITLMMAQEVLADHISRTDPIVHLSDIESAVARFFDVTTADIHSAKKNRTISLARSFSMHLARKYTKMSFPEIGRLMGGKNHATVILANRKIEDLVERNAEIKWNGSSGNRIEKARTVFDQLKEDISK